MKNNKPESQLKTYLVGGAVRDQLLQRKVIEKDYLVVGSTIEQMLSLGFTQVGKDFPVFLHPKTKDEYALARTEKKQGHGYTGFVCYASPDVTLEQDLLRRDLTVNAMAMDNDGNIHDPYHGKQDLQNKLLRHVSPAFSEDPLRVLRVARFAARYHQYGFTVANETMLLMQEISASNELNNLSAERVWQEMSKSFADHNPQVFFEILQQSHALNKIWPELAQQWTEKFSTTDYSVGELILRTLKATSEISDKVAIRFAVITTLLNQDDQQTQLENITKVAKQLKLPNSIKSLAIKTCKALNSINSAMNLNAEPILSLFNQLDVWRKPEEFLDVLLVCKARYLSLNKNDKADYHQSNYLTNLYQQAMEVNAKEFVEQGLTGVDIKKAIEQKRKNVISNAQLTPFN